MRLQSLRIQNYKCLRDVTLTDIPPFCAFVGANGAGKSTLFDALSFLAEVIANGFEGPIAARGGYRDIVSARYARSDIKFSLQFFGGEHYFSYEVEFGMTSEDSFEVIKEIMSVGDHVIFDRKSYGPTFSGVPTAILVLFNEVMEGATQGVALRAFFSSLGLSHLAISALRGSRSAYQDGRLTNSGDNLQRVALLLQEKHPIVFASVVDAMRRFVPGLDRIEVKETDDNRVILKFGDGAFTDPFLDRNVSDGTMKLFAYLVMLHAPERYSLLCVEEPENYLYPTIQQDLAEEFRAYANRGGQVFVSTHSPDFLNALNVDEVFWMVKEDGFTKVVRAKDDPQVVAYMNEGDRMGYLWKEGFFKGVHP